MDLGAGTVVTRASLDYGRPLRRVSCILRRMQEASRMLYHTSMTKMLPEIIVIEIAITCRQFVISRTRTILELRFISTSRTRFCTIYPTSNCTRPDASFSLGRGLTEERDQLLPYRIRFLITPTPFVVSPSNVFFLLLLHHLTSTTDPLPLPTTTPRITCSPCFRLINSFFVHRTFVPAQDDTPLDPHTHSRADSILLRTLIFCRLLLLLLLLLVLLSSSSSIISTTTTTSHRKSRRRPRPSPPNSTIPPRPTPVHDIVGTLQPGHEHG